MPGTRSSTPSSLTPEQVRSALEQGAPAWCPGLAKSLLDEFERQHRAQRWNRESYGTHRWIARDTSVPRASLGVVRAGSHEVILESLPAAARRHLSGLPALNELPAADVPDRLQAPIKHLASVAGLTESVGCLTRSCHVLAAERGYDVSHSTPALPLSIFVSVPDADERHAELRLAESILHEAMHLQLTLLESIVALVEPGRATAFSPWKRSQRPVQGLLHGLYVFAVIHEVLGALAADDRQADSYAEVRCPEIAAEIAAMGDARRSLTADGRAIWDELVSRVIESV